MISSTFSYSQRHYPLFKWAGGKGRLLSGLFEYFPSSGEIFVEPFLGSGVVFLNTDYQHYILADINQDLINTYNIIRDTPDDFLEELATLWKEDERTAENYLRLREEFNLNPFTKSVRRSAIFYYMNRVGFHGLCRYSSKGNFNVPFGTISQKLPPFPEERIKYFLTKAANAEFLCQDFKTTLRSLPENAVVYCDPPYAPIKETSFRQYSMDKFSTSDHVILHEEVVNAMETHANLSIYLSNHSTDFTHDLYKDADRLVSFNVDRNIAKTSDQRTKVSEILAIYEKGNNKHHEAK